MAVCGPTRNLRAVVDSAGTASNLSPWGGTCPFRTEDFEGTVFFAHKPRSGSGIHFDHHDLLNGRGATVPIWEIQIQGRFRTEPSRENIYFGFELWEGAVEVGYGTAALLHIILAFCGTLARQRGLGLTYSFGDDKGGRPRLAFALAGADRIFVSNAATPLPIKGGAAMGVWEIGSDGEQKEIARQDLAFDTERHFTFLFASPRIDFETWTAPTGAPGLGTVEISKLWGEQAVHVVVFSDDPAAEASSPTKRKYLCEVAIDSPVDGRATQGSQDNDETPQCSWTTGFAGIAFVLLVAIIS